MSLIETLRTQRETLLTEAGEIAKRGVDSGQPLSQEDGTRFDALTAEVEAIDTRMAEIVAGEARVQAIEADFHARRGITPDGRSASPLAVRADVLDAVQAAIAGRSAGRWVAGLEPAAEQRAALTPSNTGGRHSWSAATLRSPRLLHQVAGVPIETNVAAITAEYLRAGAPASAASVAPATAVSELTSVTGTSVTLARYGRYTSLTREHLIAADSAGTITSLHRRSIALDLDTVLITLISAAAPTGTGVVTGSAADVALRIGLATVADATGAEVPDLTIVANPADAGLIENVDPVGGATLGEVVATFGGAKVYYSSIATSGTALVFDGASAKYLEAQALTFDSDVAVTTGVVTLATSVIGGYGTDLIAGGVRAVTLA
ncbi:MAG: hypothetical protein KQH57_07325 [Actinomycetales bacterium]|nr:hypothetical protein [Actinomycetales bacterium]